MLFAETDPTLTAALVATLLALVPLIQIVTTILQTRYLRRDSQRVEARVVDAAGAAAGAATEAAEAAKTAKAQAQVTAKEITAVHSTLNGTGILGTLRKIEARQEAHEADDRVHFERTDRKQDEMAAKLEEIGMKVSLVAAVVQRGIVVEPKSPEAR